MRAILSLRLPLACITPVVGGGVLSREPDGTERVRIPGIRGQLRMWWRALQHPTPSNNGEFDSKRLFEAESDLWGGVSCKANASEAGGAGGADRGGSSARRSRVSLNAVVVKPGTDVPAGRYEGSGGQYRALPQWDGGPAFGYALFPLQYDRDELRRLTAADPPARCVRHDLQFDLLVALALRSGTDEDRQLEIRGLMATLWAWIHLGGIGSRTTRGFGALALRVDDKNICLPIDAWVHELAPAREGLDPLEQRKQKQALHDLVSSQVGRLLPLFEPPEANQLETWWGEAEKRFQLPLLQAYPDPLERPAGPHPRLPARRVLVGPGRPGAREAHTDGLMQLKHFRQGPGMGRRPGAGNRPGRSFWPEPDTLRRLAHQRRGVTFGAHEPLSGDPGRNGAPRAAFGMPLIISFKDQSDKNADGAFVPTYDGTRWISPLRVRPLRCARGQFVCQLVQLRQDLPADESGHAPGAGRQVAAALNQVHSPQPFPPYEKQVPVFMTNRDDFSPNSELKKWMDSADGDAVAAFLNWLRARGFRELSGGAI